MHSTCSHCTRNWTETPQNWTTLRDIWEIGHAVSAMLAVLAFDSVVWAVLRNDRSQSATAAPVD